MMKNHLWEVVSLLLAMAPEQFVKSTEMVTQRDLVVVVKVNRVLAK